MADDVPQPLSDKVPRRDVIAWAMYDWANSAWTTLSISVLYIYLSNFVIGPQSEAAATLTRRVAVIGMDVRVDLWGNVVWAWGLGASMLTAAILSPIVGAMADARATKRWWLAGTAYTGVAATLVMALLPTESAWLFIGCFLLAALSFDLSFGFYNGFLPEIADDESMDRVSAWGFALGYIGGGLALVLAVLLLTFGEHIGLHGAAVQLRVGLLILAVWWGGFTLPTVLILKDRNPPRSDRAGLWRSAKVAVREVRTTLRHIRQYRILALFLVGFLFFNDGIQTVITQAGPFAQKELQFDSDALVILLLAFQGFSFVGAVVVGPIVQRLGQKRTLITYLSTWIVILLSAYFITNATQLWILSFFLGLVIGGTQSVARAIMGMMTPKDRTAEFFGFYNLSGKATSWMGSVMFGWVLIYTGSTRLGIVSLLVFFAIGLTLIGFVNVDEGRRQAREAA